MYFEYYQIYYNVLCSLCFGVDESATDSACQSGNSRLGMPVHSKSQCVLSAAIVEHNLNDTSRRDCRAAGWPRNSNAVNKAIMARRDIIAAAEPLAQTLLDNWTNEDEQHPYEETELGVWIAIAMCKLGQNCKSYMVLLLHVLMDPVFNPNHGDPLL